MTEVEIEYCVPCGFLPRAEDVQHRLLDEFGGRIDRVALVTGDHGVFTVAVDGERVFDKEKDEYDLDAVVDRVADRIDETA
ncbi:MAG: SelT/SelW/SelH family protein [Haloferacaceae archaeon]